MGFFSPPPRPIKIKCVNIENDGTAAAVTYTADYSDGSSKNIRANVKCLNTSLNYALERTVVKAELLGKVHIGLIKSRVKYIFLVTLVDNTVDVIQEDEKSVRCKNLSSKANGRVSVESACTNPQTSDFGNCKMVEDIDIPIEILRNLYSLSISNVALKHHQTYSDGKKQFDYVTLRCRINYCLNGRKEGKRCIVFTSYDEKDRVVEICGTHKKYHFTETGFEIVETCFDDYGDKPISKISISVNEV